ncbi:MAG: low molecular weight phosphotyrosine protein phosphatase [Chloroflexi bacterium]|nr:low molecular weight phosphotyrosine protein phosphatase [Chloroflexota bacterium]
MTQPVRILFVCLGNIIRSPLAARLFEREVEEAGLEGKYEADAAGTADYHVGQAPDERMVRTAARRGFHYTHRARQIERSDLDEFDLVIPMDLENKTDIEALARKPEQRAKIHLLREFDPKAHGALAVPDPWYGGPSGFEDAYDIIERSARGLLEALEAGKLP